MKILLMNDKITATMNAEAIKNVAKFARVPALTADVEKYKKRVPPINPNILALIAPACSHPTCLRPMFLAVNAIGKLMPVLRIANAT